MGSTKSKAWLWALVAFMFFSQTGLNIARPQMSYKLIALGAPPFTIGLVTSAYAIVPVFAAIAMGRLAQRIKRLRLLVLGGGLLIAVGTAMLAVVDGVGTIACASLVFGMGHLVSQIGSQSAVSRYASDSGLDQGFGWITAGLSAGQLVGPLIGGWVLGLHADPSEAQRLDDIAIASWIGAGCALISIVFMLLPVVKASSHPQTEGSQTQNADMEDAPEAAEPAASKATTRRILGTPGVASHILASMAMLSIMDILTSFLPLVGEQHGVAPVWVGILLAARSLASIVSRSMISVLSARWNRTKLVLVSLVLSSLTVAAVPPIMSVIPAALVLLLVGGFFIGLAQPLTMTMIIKSVPTTWRSPALAVRLTGNRVGQVLIPLVAGAVVAPVGPAGAMWLTCALLLGSAGEKAFRYSRQGATNADL
ncbi:MFS transporter [Rothia sp. HC945]|uniref:MFS transporter n=1 Tax=Rothia sp. HC945 TaxID=3171170 RepID=UPI00264F9ABA|nr:MFS transporter [Kocuria sp.]